LVFFFPYYDDARTNTHLIARLIFNGQESKLLGYLTVEGETV